MGLEDNKKQTAKITLSVFESLKTLRKEEKFFQLDIDDMDHYDKLGDLVEEGYLEKNSKEYSITDKGLEMLDDIEHYIEDEKLEVNEETVFDLGKMEEIKEENDKRDVIRIEYMRKHPTEDLIENHTAIFEKDPDGRPIIVVSPESYGSLVHRNPGEHWRGYVGDAGRKLIREKKLEKVYIQNEETGRKYLYEVPKK